MHAGIYLFRPNYNSAELLLRRVCVTHCQVAMRLVLVGSSNPSGKGGLSFSGPATRMFLLTELTLDW